MTSFIQSRVAALLITLVLFQSAGLSQDCNENPNSPHKLFVFVGEFIEAKRVPARENYNEARFSATYKILEKICGNYQGDTIRFDVTKVDYDSSFMRTKYLLLVLTKDSEGDDDFVLWADLYNDVFKTADGQWAGPYLGQDNVQYASAKSFLKPKRIKFSSEAFYNTKGMTREEIDVAFPEPYFKYRNDKAIPVFGNTVSELFQFQKDGFLRAHDVYGQPDPIGVETDSGIVVQDVQLEEAQPYNYDSSYLVIKDSLSNDPFNEKLIRELLRHCAARDKLDDCSQYFENLISNYPDSVKAYLLKAQFMFARPSLEDSSRIIVLQQAVKVDSKSYEANYQLALAFYGLFRLRHNPYYARTARTWFMRSADINITQRPFLKYPIIQLSNYLSDTATVNSYKKFMYQVNTDNNGIPTGNRHNWYFPFDSFMDIKNDWMNDYDVDMVRELRSAFFNLDWFSHALAFFDEPVLGTSHNSENYRFLWLRSFHAPVVIGIIKNKRDVCIYWKVPKYNGQLEKYDPPVEFSKRLTMAQWNKFQKLLSGIDYWSMVSTEYSGGGVDGAIWLLEAAVNGRYKVTERHGDSYPKYTKCLSYLISLTDLTIPEGEFY